MRPNPALQRLRGGETVLGMFAIDLYSTGLARTATSAGAEFVVFDQEHTGWGLDQIRPLLAAARASRDRPAGARAHARRARDRQRAGARRARRDGPADPRRRRGARGRGRRQVPARGRRAASGSSTSDEHEGDVAGYMRWANDELMVIAMVETVSALDDLDAIAAIDGIDVLWIGHFDLTASMGIAGQFDHPRYADGAGRGRRRLRAQRHRRRHLDRRRRSTRSRSPDQGFRFIAVGHDIVLLRDALQQRLADVRARPPDPPSDLTCPSSHCTATRPDRRSAPTRRASAPATSSSSAAAARSTRTTAQVRGETVAEQTERRARQRHRDPRGRRRGAEGRRQGDRPPRGRDDVPGVQRRLLGAACPSPGRSARRSAAGCARSPGMRVEIDVIAYVGP